MRITTVKSRFVALCAVLTLGAPVSANAAVIDFSTVPLGNVSIIGDATFSLAGAGQSGDPFNASVQGTNYLLNSKDDFGSGSTSNSILRVAFSSPVSGLSIQFNPFGLNNTGGQQWSIFDSSFQLLASGDFTQDGLNTYDLSAYTGVARLDLNNGQEQITGPDQFWLQGLASIKYTLDAAVPEPGTMLMLGLGLTGLGVMRRRKTA